MDDQVLNGDVENSGCSDRGKQRYGDVFARVTRFAGSDEGGVESGVGIHHEENGFEPGSRSCVDGSGSYANPRPKRQHGKTRNNEEGEQAHFRYRKDVAYPISASDAAIVHGGKE